MKPSPLGYKSFMAKLFDSQTGARVVIASADHCPPHVHALHQGEGWVVRLWFSFASRDVGVLSIDPRAKAVRQGQINLLLDEIAGRIRALRLAWWDGTGTTCLDNKWVVQVSEQAFSVGGRNAAGAKQIRSALYGRTDGVTELRFLDGSCHKIDGRDAG